MTLMPLKLRPAVEPLKGRLQVPGDKSISHRSVLLGALAQGTTLASGLLRSGDVESTVACLRRLGVEIRLEGTELRVEGCGGNFRAPGAGEPELDCGNSGTTMRLLMGMLSGAGVRARLVGDESLSRRPMKRVAEPLGRMGARFELSPGGFAPVRLLGPESASRPRLAGAHEVLPIPSAQVKSALILAALQAEGDSLISGRIDSRDHTERMLADFGGLIKLDGSALRVPGGQRLKGTKLEVPGDPSSAAFFLAAAALVPGSELEIVRVSLNPSRLGMVRALEAMGAHIELETTSAQSEPIGTIRIRHSGSGLKAIEIDEEQVPSMIDELPLLAVLAARASGTTRVRGARELRVKESDRIAAIVANLQAMGARIEALEDGFVVEGRPDQPLKGVALTSQADHRIAMSGAIAALVALGETTIDDVSCVGISYPGFVSQLAELADVVV